VVERPRAGYRIPIDVGAADPRAYASLYASPPAPLADLARHPATAEHIAFKLAHHFVQHFLLIRIEQLAGDNTDNRGYRRFS